MMGWQWHQLDHMQIICTSLQTDNRASTSTLKFFTGQMPFVLPNQQRPSTEGYNLAMQVVLLPYAYCLVAVTQFGCTK